MAELSLEEGKKLIELARKSIKYFLATRTIMKEIPPKKYSEKQGVFVSLHKKGELRGCVGFPYPVMPLWTAVIEAGVSAGFNDPRFESLKAEELEEIEIEISVLSSPKEIKESKSKAGKKIRIGKDGLIIEMNGRSGLLLPQVAVEWKWNPEEFLEQTCIKAGLNKKDWKQKECIIKCFQAQIFKEKKRKVIEVRNNQY